jgi:hypothetical protein
MLHSLKPRRFTNKSIELIVRVPLARPAYVQRIVDERIHTSKHLLLIRRKRHQRSYRNLRQQAGGDGFATRSSDVFLKRVHLSSPHNLPSPIDFFDRAAAETNAKARQLFAGFASRQR